MQIRTLGAAAGGGIPQWNCRCPNCISARQASPDVKPLTQSSVAISSDGTDWYILNASPDIRQQIQSFPALTPDNDNPRGTGIAGCILTDAEIDHTSGLLFLREGTLFQIYSTPIVRQWLREKFPVEPILSAFRPRPWIELCFDEPVNLTSLEGVASTLWVEVIDLDPHPPIYAAGDAEDAAGSVVALSIEDRATGGTFLFAPGVESISTALDKAAQRADVVFFDGTFWSLTEMVDLGLSTRNAQDMGHLPIHGEDGSLTWFRENSAKTKVYFHINNTNPILNRGSAEYGMVVDAGIQVGQDGDAFDI